jgi:hypothetical protein
MMIATKMPKAKNGPVAFTSRTKLFCAAHVLVLASLLIGCGKKASDEIDFGTFNKSIYTNAFFGLQVSVPADWSIQDQEAQRRMMKLGGDVVAGDDKSMKSFIKAAGLKSIILFSAFEHPLGTPAPFNSSVTAVAEKVKELPGIKGGKDCLFLSRRCLSQARCMYPIKRIFIPNI